MREPVSRRVKNKQTGGSRTTDKVHNTQCFKLARLWIWPNNGTVILEKLPRMRKRDSCLCKSYCLSSTIN